ncbi:MAG: helix-turn-helix transcriptional regulator [Lachnospiraceae bacterium]
MDKQQLQEIGQRLREKRTSLNLTREEFAELADISSGFYGQIEVGSTQMSIDTLIKIASSMHLPFEYMLFGTGYTPQDANPVLELLHNCDKRQLKLAEHMLKYYLMKVN